MFNVYVHEEQLSENCKWDFKAVISDSGEKCHITGDFNASYKELRHLIYNRQGLDLVRCCSALASLF